MIKKVICIPVWAPKKTLSCKNNTALLIEKKKKVIAPRIWKHKSKCVQVLFYKKIRLKIILKKIKNPHVLKTQDSFVVQGLIAEYCFIAIKSPEP